MSEYTEIESFVVADGALADAMKNLIWRSALSDLVTITTRSAMFGSGKVTEVENASGRDIHTWSSGEQILWNLITSVAGRSEVNLNQVVSFFAPCPERPYIAAVLNAVWEA